MMTEHEWQNQERLTGAREMAGGICHELNQPLQAVEGFSELLLMKISEDSPLFDTATHIKQQVDKMGEITRKLMWLQRYETKSYLRQEIIDIDKATVIIEK
jgi:C4-dicarboxylate-specific signal transduction histidine kinase